MSGRPPASAMATDVERETEEHQRWRPRPENRQGPAFWQLLTNEFLPPERHRDALGKKLRTVLGFAERTQ